MRRKSLARSLIWKYTIALRGKKPETDILDWGAISIAVAGAHFQEGKLGVTLRKTRREQESGGKRLNEPLPGEGPHEK